MRKNRKEARDLLNSLHTVSELEKYLQMLRITDEEREVARMIYAKGYSRQQIAMQTGYSKRQVDRMVAKIHDRLI